MSKKKIFPKQPIPKVTASLKKVFKKIYGRPMEDTEIVAKIRAIDSHRSLQKAQHEKFERMVSDGLELGYWIIKDGIIERSAWEHEMIKEVGEGIKPYLETIWETKMPRSLNADRPALKDFAEESAKEDALTKSMRQSRHLPKGSLLQRQRKRRTAFANLMTIPRILMVIICIYGLFASSNINRRIWVDEQSIWVWDSTSFTEVIGYFFVYIELLLVGYLIANFHFFMVNNYEARTKSQKNVSIAITIWFAVTILYLRKSIAHFFMYLPLGDNIFDGDFTKGLYVYGLILYCILSFFVYRASYRTPGKEKVNNFTLRRPEGITHKRVVELVKSGRISYYVADYALDYLDGYKNFTASNCFSKAKAAFDNWEEFIQKRFRELTEQKDPEAREFSQDIIKELVKKGYLSEDQGKSATSYLNGKHTMDTEDSFILAMEYFNIYEKRRLAK